MSVIRRLREEESGTSVVLVVFALVAMLGFAAVAVDAAAAWSLKRQDQSAADTSAVAGGIFTAGKDKATAIADATDEVIRISYNTVAPNMTPAQWQAEWYACSDPAKPAKFTDVGASDCISFTSNLDEIRVQTPEIPWDTTFAKVMGFNEVNTSAFAEVETESADNGGVLPFAMPGVAGNDGEICLKTGPSPGSVPPCDGPDTGNFGFLDFSKFGDPPEGIPSVCQGGNDRLEDNIALGVDHVLGTAPGFPAQLHSDRNACNDGNKNAEPWNVDTKTGNVAQALDDGLVDMTSNGVPGRLRGAGTRNVRGHILNDVPLWNHITGGICSGITEHEALATCLSNPAYFTVDPVTGDRVWNQGVIFDSGIGSSPRFGWVPLTYENTLGPGSTTVTFREFRPVYIQTTFWGCNPTGCSLEWDPGTGPPAPGPNNVRVEAATAIQLPLEALPEELRDIKPGTPGQTKYLLSE